MLDENISNAVPPALASELHDNSGESFPKPLQTCVICSGSVAKYTCPRCNTRTCSLQCSNSHKSLGQGCSGVRDKAAYIPMNQYGYMALMDDYVYLEEIGRKVGDWGKEIIRGNYRAGISADAGRGKDNGRGRGVRGRGRGRGRADMRADPTRSKREILKTKLEEMDIELELLPVGMERRILNQSTWDINTKTALLTIEFIIHPPPHLYATNQTKEPFRLLTHRNRLGDSIKVTVTSKLAERSRSKKEKPIPEWLKDMLVPSPEDPEGFTPPICVMRAPVDLQTYRKAQSGYSWHNQITRKRYYKLHYDHSLGEMLRNKQLVEFPTIEVWEQGAFTGIIVDDRGAVQLNDDDFDEPRPKRRKLGIKEGRKAINGLVGGYGSEEEEEEEVEGHTISNMLSGYAGSDDEGEGEVRISRREEDDGCDMDAEGETDDGEYFEDEEDPEKLAALLEQLHRAGALRDPGLNSLLADEDQVDWGEYTDEE